MTDHQLSSTDSDVTTEACAWLAQLEAGNLTADDLIAFREWMGRSPRHASEMRRLARLSKEVNVLTEMAEPLKVAADSFAPIVRTKERFSFGHGFAGVAALFLVAFTLVTGSILAYRATINVEKPFIIATEIGGYRETVLSDGTIARLNTNTQIEVDYERNQRSVRLLKGEAYFEVTHNSKRPFIVYVRDKTVTAVGTAFVVRMRETDLEVTVSDGRVKLAVIPEIPVVAPESEGVSLDAPSIEENAAQNLGIEPLILSAGESLTFHDVDEADAVAHLSERDLQRELSWQQGLLDFSETPLSEVIAEVSRHTLTEIEIVDSELEELQFGGIFRTGETQALIGALELSYGIEAVRVNENLIRLRSTSKG